MGRYLGLSVPRSVSSFGFMPFSFPRSRVKLFYVFRLFGANPTYLDPSFGIFLFHIPAVPLFGSKGTSIPNILFNWVKFWIIIQYFHLEPKILLLLINSLKNAFI